MKVQSDFPMYDVAVVGQGPAGGMTALRLAEAGHSVIAFDRKKKETGQNWKRIDFQDCRTSSKKQTRNLCWG